MNRSRLTSLAAGAALCLAPLGAAGVALAGPMHADAHADSVARTGIIDCTGHEVRMPRSYVLACGDGDTSLTHLRWRDWGTSEATATGAETVNLCNPDCADGKDASFPVTVVVDRLRGGLYHEIVVHAGARRPKGVSRTERWTPIKPGQ